MTDLTKSKGVVTLRIQPSLSINQTYTYTHNVNLKELQEELNKIEYNLNTINPQQRNIHYDTLIKTTLVYAKTKLSHLYLDKLTRPKRGLINGLGTAISWITGNMDANDKAKYDKLIKQVAKNEINMQHNLQGQLSVNQELINKFNKDISIIRNNNKIKEYFKSVYNETAAINIAEQYNLLFITLQLIVNKINDLTLSAEFCKTGILHSSVITSGDLNQVLKNHQCAVYQ